MRPITLKMAGLRSYRKERTIDFGDPGLIAIIGDTGAGKSSILEAITGALYGACTWDNRGIGELISDAAHTIQLELTFYVAGQTWTVSRSASRNNYPPSRHVLRCHETGEKIIGERAVTSRVTDLLGLDTKQFLRVVVLPQNRFMKLLNATRGERNTILKGIFRLDDLDRVRQAAEALLGSLEPKLTQAKFARARLAPDPAAQLVTAQTQRTLAEQDKTKLQQIRDQVSGHDQTIAAHERTAAQLRSSQGQLAAARSRIGDPDQVLAAIERTATDLDAHVLTLGGRRHELEARESTAQQALDAATAAGQDAATLAAAAQQLDGLASDIPALISARHTLTLRDQDLARQSSDVAALQERLLSRTGALEAAAGVVSLLKEETDQAQRRCDQARQGLTALRQAVTSAVRAADQSDQRRQSLAALRQQARNDAASAERATADAQEADAALQEARRQNSAASAAANCHPGDPCPVCERPLPETFRPPESVNQTAAKTNADRLGRAATDADHAASTAAERARRAADDLADSLEEETSELVALAHAADTVFEYADDIPGAAALTRADVDEASTALAGVAVMAEPTGVRDTAGDLTGDPTLDEANRVPAARREAAAVLAAIIDVTASGIDILLEPLTRRAAELHDQHEQSTTERDQLARDVAELKTRAAERSKTLGRDREQLIALRDELIQDATRIKVQLAALPPMAADVAQAVALTPVPLASLTPAAAHDDAATGYGPVIGTVTLPANEGDAFAASFGKVTAAAAARLKEAREKLDGHDRDLRQARQELGSLSQSEKQLTADRARDVTSPLRQFSTALQTVHTRASDLLRDLTGATVEAADGEAKRGTLGLALPHAPVGEMIMAEQVTQYHAGVNDLLTQLDILSSDAAGTLASLEHLATAEREAIAELLARCQLTDIASLRQAEIDAATRWEVADRDARRFSAEKPVAAALDSGIAEVSAALNVLRAVARALTSTRFVDFVIGRRSTELLLVASRLLGQLTDDGYGFTEEFQIIDRRTRTERDVKTLSGGETFLASLALALGLVELAGRGGGRIDSLFLDEGFGSLDTTILAEALDVLRSHVSTGRLVAVISHLHAVAADLDRVLLVTKSPTGSDLQWLTSSERERLLFDDVSAGLLR